MSMKFAGETKLVCIDNTFEIVYVAGFVAGSVIRELYTFKRRQNKIANKPGNLLDTVLLSLAVVGLIAPLFALLTPWLDFVDYQLPAWAGWAGTAVFAAALCLLWRSHASLGSNWSASIQVRTGHILITEGVYRYIRHPIYAAHWLWAIAQVLLIHNWIAGPVFLVVFVPLYFLRVPHEEKLMLESFGDRYRRYMQTTGRIIPRLWQ